MFNSYPNMYPNPYSNPYQERLASMEQQQAYSQAPMHQFKMMLVSNVEEANATPVDTLNGLPSFFYNKSQNEIYMKQFNSISGGAIFQTYKLQTMETPVKQADPYEAQFRAINEKIDGLYSLLKPSDSDSGQKKKKVEVTND